MGKTRQSPDFPVHTPLVVCEERGSQASILCLKFAGLFNPDVEVFIKFFLVITEVIQLAETKLWKTLNQKIPLQKYAEDF